MQYKFICQWPDEIEGQYFLKFCCFFIAKATSLNNVYQCGINQHVYIDTHSFKTLKWKAGVSNRRRRFHFSPSDIRSPSPSHGRNMPYINIDFGAGI